MIPTYVINLKRRPERRRNVLREFEGRSEFAVTVVEAIENERGAAGLWMTIQSILLGNPHDFFLLCEDDHQFTAHYSRELLLEVIGQAKACDADILSGGVSWFEDGIQVSEHLFSIHKFSGLQFTLIFSRAYDSIISAPFGPKDVSDNTISDRVPNKFVVHPFLSTQREYGYSDVTPINNEEGLVGEFFRKSDEHFRRLTEVRSYYARREPSPQTFDFRNTVLPVYAINLPERTDRLAHLRRQFEGRPEFDLHVVEATRHRVGGVGLWMSIRKVVQAALDQDEDVVIVCEDDHTFTEHYSRDYLFRNIIEAHEQGAAMLIGGVANFGHAVPISAHRYWVNFFWCSQFVVLYKTAFRLIVDEPFDDSATADGMLSEVTSNKMVVYPFVSVQQDFGYSDASPSSHSIVGRAEALFASASNRLGKIRQAFRTFVPPLQGTNHISD